MSQLALSGGRPVRTRPFPAWPVFDGREEQALLDVLHSGKWWRFSYGEGVQLSDPDAGPQSQVAQFQSAFAARHDARFGIACANGTAAIEIALKALGLGPGDEVIVPPYTFVATASAVLSINAIPIFADIDPETYNLDPAAVEAAITPRTRAMIPVHFAGQAADMETLLQLAQRHRLALVEDAAHAHGAAWRGHPLGSLGDAGAFSFQASKNMTAGEGGIILTNRADVAAACESLVWAGREPGRPWYEHHRLGWNYRLTEFQGALLLQQLQRLDEQMQRRMANAAWLSRELSRFQGLRPLAVRADTTAHAWHIFILRFDAAQFGLPRERFLAALNAEGIPCMGGYAHPLYRNPMFLQQNFYPRGCPVNCHHYGQPLDYSSFAERCPHAEQACREAVWLEHRLLLGDHGDMEDIVAAVEKIYRQREAAAAGEKA